MKRLLKVPFTVFFALLLLGRAGAAAGAVLDDFSDATRWAPSASDQVRATLRRDAADGSLCLDADFGGVSGYAVMRRELPVAWPAHFDLQLRLKGSGAVNDVQIKLVDASGDNVWWVPRPSMQLPRTLTDIGLRARHVSFAWGPAADRSLRQTQFVEFVVAAGREGGQTTLCVASLALEPRAPDPAQWPQPQLQLQRSAGRLDVDFGMPREFNGVALRWPAGQPAGDYTLQASADGRRWRSLRSVRGSDGGLDALFLPDNEARHLRVQRSGGIGGGGKARSALPTLELRSAQQWPTFNAVLAELAADAPRGHLPRAFVGQQNYWTLVGVDGGGDRSALVSEDGAIEVGRGGYSVEPAVLLPDGSTVTWAGVALRQQLREGHLPLPVVTWQHPAFTLNIEAAADGPPAAPELLARYVLRNTTARAQRITLLLALRPWQVNPPQQFLSTPGGSSPVAALRWQAVDGPAGALAANGRPALRPGTDPQRVSALPFDGGLSLAALRAAPPLQALQDPQAAASALLQFEMTLAPGEARTVGWVAGLGSAAAAAGPAGDVNAPSIDARFDAAAAQWRQRLSHVTLQGGAGTGAMAPGGAMPMPLGDTLRTSLAHMLLSRDGPALRPGTRSYARTWVRDGAMMVAGLVRLGEAAVAREFVDWFALRIFASGKVPCCVDARGADPVAENDSHGQYLYAVAEVWRHTHDTAWLASHWPQVQRVVAYQEGLRQSERSDANRTPQRAHLFGLLPPSISHEGYSDKPAYAYWDDFWGLRGYKDAVDVAAALGHTEEAARWAGWRDAFQRELQQSIAAAAAFHGTAFIPGAADRGDFDPTSTTMALNPAQAEVPAALLEATFQRYWDESLARSEGRRSWRDYTPYELRNVGAFVRMGQPERAHALLQFFFSHQRPAGWNQWAEVVLPDAREPRFLGDMPHAWVSSDYIRAVLDVFAWEREADATLVIGGGWLPGWLDSEIRVEGLSTHHGVLDLRLAPRPGGWTLDLPRPLRGPAELVWPGSGSLPVARHGGRVLAWNARALQLPPLPATVQLEQPMPTPQPPDR